MISKRYYLTLLSVIPMLLAQVYVAYRAKTVAQSRDRMWAWRIGVFGGSILFATSIVTAFENPLQLPPMLATGVQTIVNLYGLVSAVIVTILIALNYSADRLPETFRRDRRQALRLLTGAGIAGPIAAAGYGVFVERTNFEVTETPVGIRSLPKNLEGLRLLQISDVHLGPYLSTKTLSRVIDSANELKPHLVFVTGDLITSKSDPLETCLLQLARLKADAPLLGCLGNHEVYADAVEFAVRRGADLGIDFLRYSSRRVPIRGESINVAGVDYEPFERAPHYLRKATSLNQSGMVNLLLSHNPDVFPQAAALGFDLTLSGHMHGGQVTCEFLSPTLNPARIMTPYVRGLYRRGDHSCYVTRGIGTLGIPVRFGARPEITLVTLRQL